MPKQHPMTVDESRALLELNRLCKLHKCKLKIDTNGMTARLTVTAPHGHWFEAEQLHEFVDSRNLPWRNDFADVLDRLRASPPKPHNDLECEWCNE